MEPHEVWRLGEAVTVLDKVVIPVGIRDLSLPAAPGQGSRTRREAQIALVKELKASPDELIF